MPLWTTGSVWCLQFLYAPLVSSSNAIPPWGSPSFWLMLLMLLLQMLTGTFHLFLSLSSPARDVYSESVLSTAGLIQGEVLTFWGSIWWFLRSFTATSLYCVPFCSLISAFCSAVFQNLLFQFRLHGIFVFPSCMKTEFVALKTLFFSFPLCFFKKSHGKIH